MAATKKAMLRVKHEVNLHKTRTVIGVVGIVKEVCGVLRVLRHALMIKAAAAIAKRPVGGPAAVHQRC